MKLLSIIFLFVTQLTFAQIGTSGGFQTPVQMGVSSTSAVLKSINNDFGLKFWIIKNISLINISKIKVEFITEFNNCEAVWYKVTIGALEDGYQATLDKSEKAFCGQ